MAKWRKLLDKLNSGSTDIRFDDMVLLFEKFGFVLVRVRGSHHIFSHPDVTELLSVQPRKDSKAKPYQLRQFLAMVEQYNLSPEEE
jgi:predicted RNA binding protein YcfA (HicA-like mRNA interferase family)